MRGHAERFGMPSPPKRIIATGGASVNRNILGIAANVFGCEVYTVQRPGNKLYTLWCFLFSNEVLNLFMSESWMLNEAKGVHHQMDALFFILNVSLFYTF
jgi:hypothetical protein